MEERQGKTIKVAPVSPKSTSAHSSIRYILAKVCFYYPQYTLAQARKLPFRDVKLLLKVARDMEAHRYMNMLQITTAPHTKKGEGVKKLMSHYEKIINKD